MHISEGALSAPVLAAGAAVALVGLSIGLKRLSPEKIPQVAVLSAAFFVGSLVPIPALFYPGTVHLVLNGLNGLVLGWAAFPSLFVALVLQALLFQYGGLTVLGVNTAVMAIPAVLAHLLFIRLVRARSHRVAWVGGFLTGAFSVTLSATLLGGFLFFSGDSFSEAAAMAVAVHLPVAVVEGIVSGFCVGFLRKVKPQLLGIKRSFKMEETQG
jgi:cobalt/nickel transport system permease protein